jgi:putative transcriptional regulator
MVELQPGRSPASTKRDKPPRSSYADCVDSLRGKLLLASPTLIDPNFRRTVVLITEHTDEGAMGLVLNRPSDASVNDAVPELAWLTDDPDDEAVFMGGPVTPGGVMVLAEFSDPFDAAAPVIADIGFVPGDVDDQDAFVTGLRRRRIYAGHSGWGAGQLEAEMEEDSWIVEEARPDDIFSDDPEELWSAVLRRMGRQYALLATMPLDPSLN